MWSDRRLRRSLHVQPRPRFGETSVLPRSLVFVVVLALNLLAGTILFAIHLLVLLLGQLTAIGLTICMHLLVDALLLVLSADGLAGAHLSRANAVGDALLLVALPLAHLAVAWLVGRGVVLVVVDRPADVVLPLVDLLLLLRGELAAVGRAVRRNLMVDAGVATLEVLGFAGGQLTRGDAIGDAPQLIGATIVHRGHRHRLRTAMVHRGELSAILTHRLLVAHLIHRRLHMLLTQRGLLLGVGAGLHAAGAAVVADAVVVVVHDNGLVVDVVNVRDVDVVHGTVVGEGSVAPVAALIPDAAVAEAVVHAAVEADMRTPIACVEDVSAAAPSPVPGGPEIAHHRRPYPNARNPVVAVRPIRPVARCPEIAISRAERLRIDRQYGRCGVHGDNDACKRSCWHKHQSCCNNELPN